MKVLAVCAHPDDEALGCGGTLARHAAAGDEIAIAFFTDGERARPGASAASVEARRAAAQEAARFLGAGAPEFADFPDNRLDTVPLIELARHVEELIGMHRPQTVYTHHGGDLNIDHRLVFQAVMTAARPTGVGHRVEGIYSFEVPSSTEWSTAQIGPSFAPNHFVDIADTLEKKQAALDAYAGELRGFPHPRSQRAVRALAELRGSTAGCEAAEAFMLARRIVGQR